MYELGSIFALSLIAILFSLYGRKFSQKIFGKELSLDALAEDGGEMAAKFSLRAEAKRKEAFFYKVLAFSFLVLGSYGVIRLGPVVAAKDTNFWKSFSQANNPALASLSRKKSGFNKVLEDAAKNRYAQNKKTAKAIQVEKQLMSELASSEKDLKNFNSNEIRSELQKGTEIKTSAAIEKEEKISKRLKDLEQKALKETDAKIFQDTQIKISSARNELSLAKEGLLNLERDLSDPKSINAKIQLERNKIERKAEENEQAYTRAKQNALLERNLLEEANKSYEFVVKDYLSLIEKAGGSSNSDWFFITSNVFRALGLCLVSLIGLKLLNLYKQAQKLASFYRSRADLVNAFLINNYDMDITVVDTIMMFTPDSLFSEKEFSKKIASQKRSSQKERIKAVNS